MSSSKLNDFIKTGKGKLCLLACVVIIIVCWSLVLFSMLGGSKNKLFPSDEDIQQQKAELAKARQEWQEQTRKQRELDQLKDECELFQNDCWNLLTDGNVEVVLRTMTEEAVAETGATLTSLGNVSISKINNNFSVAELSVNFSGTLEDSLKFLCKVDEIEPDIAWKTQELVPDYSKIRQMQQQAIAQQRNARMQQRTFGSSYAPKTNMAGSPNQTDDKNQQELEQAQDYVRFNGVLKVICWNGELNNGGDGK